MEHDEQEVYASREYKQRRYDKRLILKIVKEIENTENIQCNFFLQKSMHLHNSETTFLPSGAPVNTGVKKAPHETICSSAQTD